MRIYSSLTVDMTKPLPNGRFEVISATYIDYCGPIALLKGDNTLKNEETAQSNFSNVLANSFSTQFANQQGILGFLNNKLTAGLANPQGFDPATLASMRTAATEGTAQSFAQSQKALQESEAARGGSVLPSGVQAQLSAENANQAAAANTTAQQNINIQNGQLQNQNYWNSIQALSGVAAQDNPNGLAGAETGAANSVGDLGAAYKNSQNSQLLGALGGIVSGTIGVAGSAFGKKS
jgi:hypothetical protein